MVSVERIEDVSGGRRLRLGSMAKNARGLYPGTFDPVTLGHLDIIKRAVKLVDHLVIGVATNPSKSPLFTLEERMEMVRARSHSRWPARAARPIEVQAVRHAADANSPRKWAPA